MKYIKYTLLLAILFMSGCAPKSGFFSEDVRYESALSYTKKGEIYNSLEMKASIVATYLNCTMLHCDVKDEEVFLIAIYIDEDSSQKDKQGLYNPNYQLTLNGKKPKSIKPLDYHDDLIQAAPFRNRWSNYYLVKFHQVKRPKMRMEYAHQSYGKVTLIFAKD